MRKVFISNAKIDGLDNILIDNDFKINEVLTEEFLAKFKDDNTIFVINVHCTFEDYKKIQQQGGVQIYRHLLNVFKDCQNKLKVIFYSPISQHDLVKLQPENYVLRLLPFVELFPQKLDESGNYIKDVDGNYIDVEDWDFEEALESEIEKNKFHLFNNASENLLSGWALHNKDKIEKGKDIDSKIPLKNKKLLILDDEYIEWKKTYQTIFRHYEKEILATDYSSKEDFRIAWNNGKAKYNICDLLVGADAVLSDLYLKENHEDTKPYKTKKDIEKISGFEIVKAVKDRFPYLPYMMFTSSSKVWNAEAFRSKGVWAWAVKEISENVGKEDKKAQFEYFKDCIEKITNSDWKYVAETWKLLISCQKQVNSNVFALWWNEFKNSSPQEQTPSKKKKYDHCMLGLDIITNCLLVIDSIYSQRANFEKKSISDFTARQCFQIINNLGGICEKLDLHSSGNQRKITSSYIYGLRNLYSHEYFYKSANPLETVFCINLMIRLLMLDSRTFKQESNANLVPEKEFQINTNVNYYLQLKESINSSSQVSYDSGLLQELENRYKNIKDNIVSNSYEKIIKANQRVIDVVDAHIKQVP